MKKTVKMLAGEVWYGPSSNHGAANPHGEDSVYSVNIETGASCNQDNPLLLSSLCRIIWAPKGFDLHIEGGVIDVSSKYGDIELLEGYGNLRGAYLEACRRYFLTPGVPGAEYLGAVPPEEFFRIPQYNTWIELIYDQNQEDVLRYAHGIIENGMPAGILMIDDGWNNYYGSFRFSAEKFPDPAGMCRELHELGFKVMMWICPFISPDSPEYRYLAEHGMLICDESPSPGALQDVGVPSIKPPARPAVREWWNGWSAVLDMTNPETEKWLDERLGALTALGVDGFKLDAGDAIYYHEGDVTHTPVTPAEHARLWNLYGLKYRYNEFRACFGCAGLPLVQRLHDKAHDWKRGVAVLVPDTLVQSLMGYAYTCPDMIGGGSFADFLPGSTTFDSELFLRSCAASALMPMMQFSLAPWRVLTPEEYEATLGFIALHEKYADKIVELAKGAAVSGEPVVRHLSYVFPDEGFERVTDCFMLGDDVLVAPVCEKGVRARTLRLPSGKWMYADGTIYEGGAEVTVDAPLNILPHFVKV